MSDKINVISFDVDGTLVKNDLVERFWFVEIPRMLAKKEGIDFEAAKKRITKNYDKMGDSKLEWYLPEYWFSRFGLSEEPEEVLKKIKDGFPYYPEVPDILEALEDKYMLIVISNASREFLKVNLKDIKGKFNHIFSCVSDLKQIKKDPEVFRSICEKIDISPEEIIHVGDDWEADYLSPRKSGIRSFYLDRKPTGEYKNSETLLSLSDLLKRL